MSRLETRFAQLRASGEKALVCFVTAGDPFPDATADVVEALAQGGADAIEIGIPFSDPLADGPTIQASSLRALQHGMTPPKVLDAVREARRRGVDTPIVLMGSWNPTLQYGLDAFARDAAAAGVDATIMTDLSPEEAGEWKRVCDDAGLDTVFLLAPTSTPDRMDLVGRMASGFVYCVSRTGITGARDEVPADLPPMIDAIRGHVGDLPLCVGFGISRPEHVARVCSFADGAVVGSALVTLLHETRDCDEARAFVALLKEATRP